MTIRILVWSILLSFPLSGQDEVRVEAGQGVVTPHGKFLSPEVMAAGKRDPRSGETEKLDLEKTLEVKKTGKSKFSVGLVRGDAVSGTITIPCELIDLAADKPIEYILTHRNGKIHEALFSTAVQAKQINLAALLLGAEKKDEVRIEVKWKKNGPDARFPLEALLEIRDMDPGLEFSNLSPSWIYQGSCFNPAGYVADLDGSYLAVIADPMALLGHGGTLKLRRDDIFFPRSNLLPGPGSPVELVITLMMRD